MTKLRIQDEDRKSHMVVFNECHGRWIDYVVRGMNIALYYNYNTIRMYPFFIDFNCGCDKIG